MLAPGFRGLLGGRFRARWLVFSQLVAVDGSRTRDIQSNGLVLYL
jgi:hypothetical protein